MSNSSSSKVRLTLSLLLVTVFGLGIFYTIIYTSERDHQGAILSESILAHLQVFTATVDSNRDPNSTLSANSSKNDGYHYTSV